MRGSLDFKDIPLLTREEERDLIIKSQNGDIEARNKIIIHNMGLVYSFCLKYKNKGVSFDDIFQEGILALIKAIDYFDVSKGNKFSTMAYFAISQRIYTILAENKEIIRIPKVAYYDRLKVIEFSEKFKLLNGYEPSNTKISKELKIAEKKIEFLKNMPTILFEIMSDDISESSNFEAYFKSSENVENDYINRELITIVNDILNSSDLTEKQRSIINLRFGFNCRAHTLDELALIYNCSRQNISYPLNDALKKICYNVKMFNLMGYESKDAIIRTREKHMK